jgi:hypothetical protein
LQGIWMMSFRARIVSGAFEHVAYVALAHMLRLAQQPRLFGPLRARCSGASNGRGSEQDTLLNERLHHRGRTVAGGKLTRESIL